MNIKNCKNQTVHLKIYPYKYFSTINYPLYVNFNGFYPDSKGVCDSRKF